MQHPFISPCALSPRGALQDKIPRRSPPRGSSKAVETAGRTHPLCTSLETCQQFLLLFVSGALLSFLPLDSAQRKGRLKDKRKGGELTEQNLFC